MRILLRARRDLREPARPAQVAYYNLMGDNSGNMIFAHAAHRSLARAGTQIDVDRGRVTAKDAQAINDNYDAYVLPLANAFRTAFAGQLNRYANLIERLTIPVTVLGIGAQLSASGQDPQRLFTIEPTVHRFVRAVLARSPAIGVRGEITYDYLRSLGYSDDEVQIIGCPSLFGKGMDLAVRPGGALSRQSQVVMNVSPYVAAMGPIVATNSSRYPKLEYIAQDIATLTTLLSRHNPPNPDRYVSTVPYRVSDPLIAQRRALYFIDPVTWVEYLQGREFSFGTRIHGNIAALLAGTPAVLLAHDSRTLELAQYHEIPYRLISEVEPSVDPAQLLEQADYSDFHRNHGQRYQRFIQFLDSQGLPHTHNGSPAATSGLAEFDRAIERARTRHPVRLASPPAALRNRTSWRSTDRYRSMRFGDKRRTTALLA